MDKYIIHKDKLIGEGVDGKVYKANFLDKEIVVKIMDNQFYNKDKFTEFIEINKIASKESLGPLIYDIYFKDDLIYIFMQQLDITIAEYVEQKIAKGTSFELVKEEIKNKVKILHTKLKDKGITIEENNSENYMFKDDELKRIDFTKSKIKTILGKNDINGYKFIHMFNPITTENIKVNVFE